MGTWIMTSQQGHMLDLGTSKTISRQVQSERLDEGVLCRKETRLL